MKTYKSLGASNAVEVIRVYCVAGPQGQETAACVFLALFIAGNCPPNQRASLAHGFPSKSALRAYCAYNGIALFETTTP